MLTHNRLTEVLAYSPELGEWRWIKTTSKNSRLLGQIAGTVDKDGYRRIRIDGVSHISSRLAFFYMTGRWPEAEMDHNDLNPGNDIWINLREATSSNNKCNSRLSARNSSGFRGVSWSKAHNKWRADVSGVNVGFFDNVEEAVIARDSVASNVHGAFVSLNLSEGMVT